MYAIVKTGGKQYRVEQGQSLLVERLSASEGDSVALDPLLYVDGSEVVDSASDGLGRVSVQARVVGHERGPKLRVVKFKPKRGYRRRNGHRQALTRVEIVGIKLAAARGRAKAAPEAAETPAPVAAAPATPRRAPAKPKAAAEGAAAPAKPRPAAKPKAPTKPKAAAKPKAPAKPKPAAKPKPPAKPRARKTPPKEDGDGT